MKHNHRFLLVSIPLWLLLSCTTPTAHDKAWQSYEDGRYAEAIAYSDQAIQNPTDDHELYRAYLLRAESHLATGSPERAFHDYYAAKIVSCYLERHKKSAKGYGVGMIPSTYCRKWSGEKMAAAASKMPQARTAALKREAETTLSRFLE